MLPDCFALNKARTKVIGIIARVLVSLTVTALSSVWVPRFHILSQVEAVAVTDEVSLTAVPANIPKASPDVVSNPKKCPNIGNNKAAKTLKKKITEIAWATSSSSASIIGAVAAMAEPPQIEDPTPIKVLIFESMCIALWSANAIIKDVEIVQIIIGSDCFPVLNITLRLRPKPNKITAYWSIFFDVKVIPGLKVFPGCQNKAITIPAMIAITALPIIGKILPSIQAGIAIARQTNKPLYFSFIRFI